MSVSEAAETILTVSAITRLIKETLAGAFPAVWVKGEISDLRRWESGHFYFTLKEGRDAALDCVMWRIPAARLGFEPRDGQEVEAFGAISVYEPRGRYQLVVQSMRPSGVGALLLALEELKRRLGAEGLFDAARKRPLPRYPRRIGLVTSPQGAAVRDMVKVLRARWPSIGIVLSPVRVQGPGAAEEIAGAIRRFGEVGGVDLLIVGRGGGSIEDLWAFNEEVVVRAIAGSPIPVISAVGHEVDFSLADAAADVRAATPSNAAEIAVRDRAEVLRAVRGLTERMDRAILQAVDDRRRRLQTLIEQYGFRRQRDALGFIQQKVDHLLARLRGTLASRLARARERLEHLRESYGLREWPRTLVGRRDGARETRDRLDRAIADRIAAGRARLGALTDRLRALSPRLVLERGYCLVRAADGRLVREPLSLAIGTLVSLEFARGEADARVEAVRPETEESEHGA